MKKNRSEKVAKKAEKKGAKKRTPYRPWKKVDFWIGCFLYALTLPIFTDVFGLWSTMNDMGYGTFRYTDQAYLDLEQAINACLTPNYGVDSIALKKEYNVEEFYNSIKGNKVLIDATKRDGFFAATVTVELDENYCVKENGVERNYNSTGDYVRDVKKHLSMYSMLYGYVAWFVVGVIGYAIISIVTFLVNLCTNKKDKNGENKAIEKQNSENIGNETNAELPTTSDEGIAESQTDKAEAPDAAETTE